jgi:hypothetical protein
MAVADGKVYLFGRFTTVSGQSRNTLAAVDAVTGQLTPWNPRFEGFVSSLAVSGSTVYLGAFLRGWRAR